MKCDPKAARVGISLGFLPQLLAIIASTRYDVCEDRGKL
jgi:hypothetical protein